MKKFMAQAVVVLAIVTSFTINAEAKPVVVESAPVGISITGSVSAVGVLAQS